MKPPEWEVQVNRYALWSCSIVALVCTAAVAPAQIVHVKTTPLAEGDQFTFLPSATRAMGGVTIAVPDTLLDPFLNPATGARLRHTSVFGAPAFYSLSRNGSAGTTLPLGVTKRGGAYFGAFALATQVVEPSGVSTDGCCVAVPDAAASSSSVSLFPGATRRHSRTNNYAFASGGRTLHDSSVALAASLQWSRLGGVDGADLLYPGADEVGQMVDNVDLRLGAVKQWPNRSAEAVLLHQRRSARHDISYLGFLWDPGTRTVVPNPHTDVNFDRRHTWGMHLDYTQRLADSAWRVGALVTANRTTQPDGPSFGNMEPSGDPGRSVAFNVGVGAGHSRGATTVGVDAVYEPIWAQRRFVSGSEDRYRFGNVAMRGGVSREFARSAMGNAVVLQGGMQWHRIQYSLDKLAGSVAQTRSSAGWNEWVHTAGIVFRAQRFDVRYEWRLASGVERPGFDNPNIFFAVDVFPGSGPQFPEMRMIPVHVTTQQFSFSVRMP